MQTTLCAKNGTTLLISRSALNQDPAAFANRTYLDAADFERLSALTFGAVDGTLVVPCNAVI